MEESKAQNPKNSPYALKSSQKQEDAVLALRFNDSLAKTSAQMAPADNHECFSIYSDTTGNL